MGVGFASEAELEQMELTVPDMALSRPQRAFLNAYLAKGTVRGAEKVSKIYHLRHYQWLDDDPAYAAAFARIKAIVLDHETELIKQRGVEGYDEELSYKGVKTNQTIRKYSDTIAIAYLKANRPEWRDGNAATSAAPVSIAITYPSPQTGGNDLRNVSNATPAPKKIT